MLLQVAPPPAQLTSTLMHFMTLNLDGCWYRLPAALSPCISLFVRGGAQECDTTGLAKPVPRLCLSGPFLTPREAVSQPGTLVLAVLFRPGYLTSSLGVATSDTVGRDIDMREIIGRDKIQALFEAVDQEASIDECLKIFQAFLLSAFKLESKKNMAETFLQAHSKMFFSLMELAVDFGIGQRQLERRVRKVFGMSLRDVRRLSRWGLCLERLVNAEISHGGLTRVAQDSGYFDQAHMAREFVEFSGVAPLLLLKEAASRNPAYWAYRIKGEDYKNLFIPVS